MQIVRIVGQSIEVRTLQNQRPGVVRRIGGDHVVGLFLNRHFLLFEHDAQHKIQGLRARADIHFRGLLLREARRGR